MQMREQEHNYQVYEKRDRIIISPREKCRPPVEVKLDKEKGYWVIGKYSYPIFSMGDILYDVVCDLYKTWKPDNENYRLNKEINKKRDIIFESGNFYTYTEEEHKIIGKQEQIKKWAFSRTKRTLARPIRDAWKNILERNFDPLRIELHKKAYSVAGRGNIGYFEIVERLYKEKDLFTYQIQDFLNYYPARVAFMLFPRLENLDWDWLASYSYCDKSYPALNKTLMNMPYVPYVYLGCLAGIYLPRAVTNRYQFLSLLSLGYTNGQVSDKQRDIILRSSEKNIKESIELVWEAVDWNLKSQRKTMDYRRTKLFTNMINYIFDYPDELGNWNLLGVTKRSIAYHNESEEKKQRRIEINRLKNKQISVSPTAQPPIPLPEVEGISLLKSYEDVVKESENMHHCVWSYAKRAVLGEIYLFHIEKEKEVATAEVSASGIVKQIRGPYNQHNSACSYGERILKEWSKNLNGKEPKILFNFDENKNIEVPERKTVKMIERFELLENLPF